MPTTLAEGLSIALGAMAFLGAAAGFGALRQRLITVERTQERQERELAELRDLKTKMATIEERTANTDVGVRTMNGKLDTLTAHLLHESRSFVDAVMRGAPMPAVPPGRG